jgi:hypothetical protein
MKRRIRTEGFHAARQEMVQFELKSPKDKRLRKHDYATRQTILRLLQSIPSPKVEEFKRWLAEVGEQRLKQEEIDRVEAELEQVRERYRQRGMGEKWIEDRILNLVGRNELTDQSCTPACNAGACEERSRCLQARDMSRLSQGRSMLLLSGSVTSEYGLADVNRHVRMLH